MVFWEAIELLVAISVLGYIQTKVSCLRCRRDQNNGQADGEYVIIDNMPTFHSQVLLKKSLQTAFAIKGAALLLGLLAIVFLQVGYDVSLVLMSSRRKVRSNLNVLMLGLYLLEYFNLNSSASTGAGMVLMVAFKILIIERSLSLQNIEEWLKWEWPFKGYLWFITYCVGCFILIIRARYGLYFRNSRLEVIQLVTVRFTLNYCLCQVIRFYLARPALSLLGIEIKENKEIVRSFVLLIAPFLPGFVSSTFCAYHAFKSTCRYTTEECSFVFIHVSRGIFLVFYGILQADFTSMWLLIVHSLLRGVGGVVGGPALTYLFNPGAFERQIEFNQRRFKANTEIQDMLLACVMTILSQAFVALCRITNCEVSPQDVIIDALVRIAVRLAIELFFSCVKIYVLCRLYNLPVFQVWKRYWIYHLLVYVITLLAVSCMYATLIDAYKIQIPLDGHYKNENCTSSELFGTIYF